MVAAWMEDEKPEVAVVPASLPGLHPSNCGACCQCAASAAVIRSNMGEISFLPTVIRLNGKLSLFLSSPLPEGSLLRWLWISDSSFNMLHAGVLVSLALGPSFSFIFYLVFWKKKKKIFRCRISYIGANLLGWCPEATTGDTVVQQQGSWGSALKSIFSQFEPYKPPLTSHRCSPQGQFCSPERHQDTLLFSLQCRVPLESCSPSKTSLSSLANLYLEAGWRTERLSLGTGTWNIWRPGLKPCSVRTA